MGTFSTKLTTHLMAELTIEQFNGLFDKEIAPETLDSLAKSASDGNLESIDLLHNIALRQDSAGKNAENILFDLFSGKRSAVKGIDKEIQKTSQVLYQSKHHREAFKHPSKLLYIIGSTLEKLDDKIELTHLFAQNLPPVLGHESDLWGNNRMITSDEIGSTDKRETGSSTMLTVNSPIGLMQNNENLLYDIVSQKIISQQPLSQLELFPVNINNNHWVLFVLYQDEVKNEIKGMVFNSFYELDSEAKQKIAQAAELAGAKKIHYIEKNIQQYVPNGCGLFVHQAIKELTEQTPTDPIKALMQFLSSFSEKTSEEQQQFNIQKRRQLYSSYLDSLKPKRKTP